MNDDFELLRLYADKGSEEAFGALVDRYKSLVYAAALRQTNNPALAEEVTQVVFVVLARKAPNLRRGVVLSGWLHTATRFAAADLLKAERRRAAREQESFAMSTQVDQSHTSEDHEKIWNEIAPVLDESLSQLGATDRNAILLRFFERKNLAAVGEALGTSEEAARKKVSRALDKLRKMLGRRGVAIPSVLLASLLTTQAAPAAPLTLIVGLSTTSTASAPLVKTTLALMASTKTKIAIVATAALLLTGGATVLTMALHQTPPGDQPRPVAATPPREPGNAVDSTEMIDIPQEVVLTTFQPARPDPEGFITIFNGVDLQGWNYNPHVWSVRDGALTGHLPPSAEYAVYCLQWSGGMVNDFELRLRFRGGPNENSGVCFRSRSWGKQRYFSGYQIELHGQNTGRFIIAGTGRERQLCRDGFRTIADERDGEDFLESFEPIAELEKIKAARTSVEKGEWCELTVHVQNHRVVARLNGVMIIDTQDQHPEKFVPAGYLGLEYCHRKGIDDSIEFKDIRIKRLAP